MPKGSEVPCSGGSQNRCLPVLGYIYVMSVHRYEYIYVYISTYMYINISLFYFASFISAQLFQTLFLNTHIFTPALIFSEGNETSPTCFPPESKPMYGRASANEKDERCWGCLNERSRWKTPKHLIAVNLMVKINSSGTLPKNQSL